VRQTPRDLIEAYFDASATQELEEYVRRGREYKSLADDELVTRWKTTQSMYFRDPHDTTVRQLDAMLSSELTIRGLSPDIDSIEGFNAARAQALTALQDMKANPERWKEANRDLGEDILKAIEKRENATKH
jgi:hypothetical protein